MDLSDIANKLGLSDSKQLIRKAAELRRLCDVQFDSSVIGVGEVCKAVICLEIAATRANVMFDRQVAVRLSGMSDKAYNRSFNSLQNGLGFKTKLDIRELGIQFGCIRLIPFVQKGLSLYKDRFLASLPATRRASTDLTRPVFTAVAFYLCAKRHKLKADKTKLIELCGSSESEFSSVSNSMKDLCHDVFGISKDKKDPRDVKGNRELLDAFPEKRRIEDGSLSDDEPEVTGNSGVDATSQELSLIVIAQQFVTAMLVMDTWQYFMHRYMHHNKFLYKHIHSKHHRLVVPYSFGALYNHPVEGLLLDTIGGALSFLISGMSPRVSIFFFSFATIKTVDDHCGLLLPGNPFHVFFRNNTAYHDVHHQLYGNKYNFSQPFFVMWDKILGTYMPYSLEKRVSGGFEARPTKNQKDE